MRSWRTQRANSKLNSQYNTAVMGHIAREPKELSGTARAELDGNRRAEFDAAQLAELDAKVYAELPASTPASVSYR